MRRFFFVFYALLSFATTLAPTLADDAAHPDWLLYPSPYVSDIRFDESAKESPAWSTRDNRRGARWSLEENKLQLAIPVEFFKGGDPPRATFKILDNVPLDSPADLYDKGDVAPESAFFYSVDFAR